jgi:hypothetical protein
MVCLYLRDAVALQVYCLCLQILLTTVGLRNPPLYGEADGSDVLDIPAVTCTNVSVWNAS